MSTTVIEFIGLFMFTGATVAFNPTAVPEKVHPAAYHASAAIAPRSLSMKRYQVTAIAPTVPAGMEPHKLIIAFNHATSVTGWQTGVLHTGWSYVALTGAARVDFISDAPNGGVTQLTNVPLPKVVGGTLQAPYKAPYTGAEGVFTITNGTLAACKTGTRYDTTLTLNVQSKLTIRSGNNSIVLPPNASVAIMNLPFALEDDPPSYSPVNGMPHSTTYCVMTGQTACTMSTPNAFPCPNSVIPGLQRPSSSRGTADASAGTDFACSNTQWP